jgi:phospholipase D1/2
LRKQIWKKLFGIAGNVRPANDLQSAIDEPGHPDSWKKIRKQAEKNAALYEAAFLFIPRNKTKQITQDGEHKYASIIPTWDDQLAAPKDAAWIKGNLASPIPCQSQFWEKGRQTQAANQLAGIKGFVTALPIEWTKNEKHSRGIPNRTDC